MMAILALDVGEKKIGVAISRSGLLSEELTTIRFKDQKTAIGEIIFLIKREKIKTVIIGLPKRGNNSASKIEDFVDIINQKISAYVSVIFEDETLTSKEAERILFSYGLNLEKMRERRDQMAAKIILDQFLDKS